MLSVLFVERRSGIASFSPAIADQYRHPNGTTLTVRRERFWRRDPEAKAWAAENGYARLRSKLSLWCETGSRAN